MPLFRRSAYDRQRLLEAAGRARARNKRRKAISLYRWILAVERSNTELHAKLGPLLAETGQTFDAWNSFRHTAQAALREGRDDKALAVYREATSHLPQEIQAWQGLARLLARRGEEAEAVEVLLDGSRHFRSPFLRPQGIHLLRRARTIAPWDFECVIELARLLGRSDQREEARILLEGLAERSHGRHLRRVRQAQLWLDPGPVTLWQLVRACTGGDAETAPAAAPGLETDPQGVVPLRPRSARR